MIIMYYLSILRHGHVHLYFDRVTPTILQRIYTSGLRREERVFFSVSKWKYSKCYFCDKLALFFAFNRSFSRIFSIWIIYFASKCFGGGWRKFFWTLKFIMFCSWTFTLTLWKKSEIQTGVSLGFVQHSIGIPISPFPIIFIGTLLENVVHFLGR